MPKPFKAYICCVNYMCTLYSSCAFPIDKNERNRLAEVISNDLGSLRDKKEITSHFEILINRYIKWKAFI